ncbi:hypothetical protein LCGC14_2377240, partial [marine sediment metagenome]
MGRRGLDGTGLECTGTERKGFTMESIELTELVLDWGLYPRTSLDTTNVRMIVQALEAGETMPPLIVDRTTKKIVDGFHRYHAYLTVLPDNGEVEVEFRDYESTGELFTESLRLNARHGRSLTPLDRANALQRGEEFGLTVEQISGALALTVERATALTKSRSATTPSGEPLMLKHTLKHLRG